MSRGDIPLNPGEVLLWQGRPTRGLRFMPNGRGNLLLGGVLVALAAGLYLLGGGDAHMGIIAETAYWVSMWLVLAFGLYWLLASWFVEAFYRRHTRYALTNQRAIILTNLFKLRLASYPISASSPINLPDLPDGSVFFARQEVVTRSRTVVNIGFYHLPDAERVYRLLLDIQKEAT